MSYVLLRSISCTSLVPTMVREVTAWYKTHNNKILSVTTHANNLWQFEVDVTHDNRRGLKKYFTKPLGAPRC